MAGSLTHNEVVAWVPRLRVGEPEAEHWLFLVVRDRFARWLSREKGRRLLGGLEQTDDLVQEVGLKLIGRVRDEPEAIRPTVPEVRRLIRWVTRDVLYDKARPHRRPAGGGRAQSEGDHPLNHLPSEDTGVSSVVDRDDRVAAVNAALGRLTPEERAAVEAVFRRGLSYREAAAELRCGLGTLRGLLRSASKTLRPALASHRPQA